MNQIDVFHAAKSMGKNAFKISKDHLLTLEKLLQRICVKNVDVPLLLNNVTLELRKKSDLFFPDINQIFSLKSFGSEIWKLVSTSPGSMRQFAVENGLNEITPDGVYWEAFISKWNTLHSGKKCVTSMSGVRLSSTMTLKSLRVLSKTVSDITGVEIPITDKSSEKDVLMSHLREMLPDICSQGYNFHTNIEDIIIKMKIESVLPLSAERIIPNEHIIISIFGMKSPTLKDLKKLSASKILLLAAHLAGEMEIDIPVGKKEISAFCISNFWRVNNQIGRAHV